MASGKLSPYLYTDSVVFVSASGLGLINIGDTVLFSASWGIAGHDATIGSPAYIVSAVGIALEPNPTVDSQGAWVNNSGVAVATRGIFRVSAQLSGTAYTIPAGSLAYPDTTGSGINGHTGGATGATGVAAAWSTAAPVDGSGATGATPSGLAQVMAFHKGGDDGSGQLDIRLNIATNGGYI